jgi:hypothetical protein
MIPAMVIMALTDNVDSPDSPWPKVQPKAMAPPKPINMAPMMLRGISVRSVKVSTARLRVSAAAIKEPTGTPSNVARAKAETKGAAKLTAL